MIPDQFLQLLTTSLADHQLSRSEKNALKTWLENNSPDPALVSRLRNAAFELARTTAAACNSENSRQQKHSANTPTCHR